MAVGAHEVPGVIGPGPRQGVDMSDLLLRIQMEPALPASAARTAVPGDAERLQTAAGKADQVLLKRRDSESVSDPVVMQRAVGSVGTGKKVAAAAKKTRRYAVVAEARVVEISQHRGCRGGLHRQL